MPLPFGVQPYFKPEYPLGSGPYKAIMATRPACPRMSPITPRISRSSGRKMPVVIWGNGSCLYAGNRYRQFLTEIASHGYLVDRRRADGRRLNWRSDRSRIPVDPRPRAPPMAAGRRQRPNAATRRGAPASTVTVPLP